MCSCQTKSPLLVVAMRASSRAGDNAPAKTRDQWAAAIPCELRRRYSAAIVIIDPSTILSRLADAIEKNDLDGYNRVVVAPVSQKELSSKLEDWTRAMGDHALSALKHAPSISTDRLS